MDGLHPAAFDAFAADYDHAFSSSRLARLLRPRVWRVLGDVFPRGSRVLEMACGTGMDAVWLAQQGVHVAATDGSPQMIEVTRRRIREAGVEALVSAHYRSLQALSEAQWPAEPPFDGAFSNFGGLNTVADRAPLARSLAAAIRPGGLLVLAPMGPFCPWEIAWHALHGDGRTAWRRFRQPASAQIGAQTIPIWYPSLRRLKEEFAPWFRHVTTRSLGLLLPPSYLGHFVDRYPRLFGLLNSAEDALARLTGSWGDHYVSVFQRASTPSNRSSMR